MSKRNVEVVVGLVLSVGLVLLFISVIQTHNLSRNSNSNEASDNKTYEIKARFDNVGGLTNDAMVKAAGVKIGNVSKIEYDSTRYEAVVTLSIEAPYNTFPIDTAASVLTSGLIGVQYVSLQPGAETEFLVSGSEIDITQSAIILEQIIGQLIYSKAGD